MAGRLVGVRAVAGVVCLVGASVGQLLQYLVTPLASVGDDPAAQVAQGAAHLSALRAASWLDLLVLLLVPAVLYVGMLAGTSLLGTLATGLTFLTTLVGSAYLLVIDVLVYQGASGAGPAGVASYLGDPLVGSVTVVFLAGHVVGFVLLAIALLRARSVPVWAAVALGLSPIAELGGQAAGVPAVTVVGYALLVVAFGAVAVALLRSPVVRAGSPMGADAPVGS